MNITSVICSQNESEGCLKGQRQGVFFPAIFNKAGLKAWLSTIVHMGNAPQTSREIYQVKC